MTDSERLTVLMAPAQPTTSFEYNPFRHEQILAISYDNEGHMIPFDVAISPKRAVAPPDHPDQFAVYVEGTAHRASK
jgi:hypothetical protein